MSDAAKKEEEEVLDESLEIEVEEEEVEEIEEVETNEETIALAKSMGWVDEEKFRGDKSRWVGADKFVEKGMNDLPILRERLRAQSDKINSMESDITSFKTHHEQTLAREYQRAVKDLEKRQLATVEEGDTDEYQRLEKERHELAVDHSRNADTPRQTADNPLFVDWKEKSGWYGKKDGMTIYADAISEKIAKDNRDLIGKQGFLDEIDNRVKKEFPDFFENPNRNTANPVESGGRAPRPRGGGNTYSDLPADAKKECDKYVRRGLLTKEQYCKDYEWE